jgi:hypothetical protein
MVNKKTIEVSVNDLQCGMYVSELDRPWLETPYLIQGILIQSQEDIDLLKRYCTTVPLTFKVETSEYERGDSGYADHLVIKPSSHVFQIN